MLPSKPRLAPIRTSVKYCNLPHPLDSLPTPTYFLIVLPTSHHRPTSMQVFWIHGLAWRLKVYPASSKSNQSSFSVYLELFDSPPSGPPEGFDCEYSMELVPRSSSDVGYDRSDHELKTLQELDPKSLLETKPKVNMSLEPRSLLDASLFQNSNRGRVGGNVLENITSQLHHC